MVLVSGALLRLLLLCVFFFSSRRRHTRLSGDWSSDVCSSDMAHGDRSVDVFVRKLRQKLRVGSPEWSYIHTHFGVGYRLAPERGGGGDPDLDLVIEPPLDVYDPALAG